MPFPSGLDSQAFFVGASQREALARLRFLLTQRRRLGLVLGASGLGKSLLLKVFAEQSSEVGHAVAQVSLLGLSPREFYWQIGTELQASVRTDDDVLRLFRQLTDRFEANGLQGRHTVLLLDDLDEAGPDVLSQVLRLARTGAANSGHLALIATSSPAQLNRLGMSLLELVDLRIDLQAWDELDTIGYLQMALFEAGAERPLFDDEAMSELYRESAGVPRAVQRIAEAALLAGSGSGLELIDVEMIHAAREAPKLPSLA